MVACGIRPHHPGPVGAQTPTPLDPVGHMTMLNDDTLPSPCRSRGRIACVGRRVAGRANTAPVAFAGTAVAAVAAQSVSLCWVKQLWKQGG